MGNKQQNDFVLGLVIVFCLLGVGVFIYLYGFNTTPSILPTTKEKVRVDSIFENKIDSIVNIINTKTDSLKTE